MLRIFCILEDNLCENSYSIYDSPVYPQQLKGLIQRWLSFSPFKEPDKKKEGDLCFKLYLSTYFSQEQLSHDDITTFYSKLRRVYDSLLSSKKINIQNVRGTQFPILNVTGEATFEMVRKLVLCPYFVAFYRY